MIVLAKNVLLKFLFQVPFRVEWLVTKRNEIPVFKQRVYSAYNNLPSKTTK